MTPGFYWIRRNEPDGSRWEVAELVEVRMETFDYWNQREGSVAVPQFYWSVAGRVSTVRQPSTPGASNRWVIGPRLEAPEQD